MASTVQKLGPGPVQCHAWDADRQVVALAHSDREVKMVKKNTQTLYVPLLNTVCHYVTLCNTLQHTVTLVHRWCCTHGRVANNWPSSTSTTSG